MGKGPYYFALGKAGIPYDGCQGDCGLDHFLPGLRFDVVVSKKFDDLLGMLGAIVFFLGVVILVHGPLHYDSSVVRLSISGVLSRFAVDVGDCCPGRISAVRTGDGCFPAHGDVGEGRRPP